MNIVRAKMCSARRSRIKTLSTDGWLTMCIHWNDVSYCFTLGSKCKCLGGIKMYPFLMSHTSYIIDCRTHSRAIEPKRSRHRRKCRLHGRHLPHGPKTKNRPPLPLQAPQAETTSRSPLCRMLRHAWRYKQISWLLTHTECIEKKTQDTDTHTSRYDRKVLRTHSKAWTKNKTAITDEHWWARLPVKCN